MKISNDRKIKEIQEEFSKKFPALKIEFYKKPHKVGEGSEATLQLDPDTSIGKIRSESSEEDLTIHGNLKVQTLEEILQKNYGLYAQVFRKSKDIWLQTTATDHWTLAEQNEAGQRG